MVIAIMTYACFGLFKDDILNKGVTQRKPDNFASYSLVQCTIISLVARQCVEVTGVSVEH